MCFKKITKIGFYVYEIILGIIKSLAGRFIKYKTSSTPLPKRPGVWKNDATADRSLFNQNNVFESRSVISEDNIDDSSAFQFHPQEKRFWLPLYAGNVSGIYFMTTCYSVPKTVP